MAELGKLMAEAEKANVSEIEKQRVALFRKACLGLHGGRSQEVSCEIVRHQILAAKNHRVILNAVKDLADRGDLSLRSG